ncbi:multiple epidermal growth factor-like domains protein 9 [Polypterus senegalus]|nr:multiple epidermal growth factor-like domains protein 9 [Polypterus senegalus]
MERSNQSMKNGPKMMLIVPFLELAVFLCPEITGGGPLFAHASTATATGTERSVLTAASGDTFSTTVGNSLPEGSVPRLRAPLLTTPAASTATLAVGSNTPHSPALTTTSTASLHPPLVNQTTAATTFTTMGLQETSVGSETAPLNRTTVTPAVTSRASATSVLPVPAEPEIPEDVCNCNSSGSTNQCNETTGQCECLEGYVGLHCTECEDGFFSNETSDICWPCLCDTTGALGPSCNSSGICTCKQGVYGPRCDECRPGFFHFSDTGCRPCECNNHSDLCQPQSGICINCQGNTEGPQCDKCKENSYRRPNASLSDACDLCPCSTVTSTGTCHVDSSGQPVCDHCRDGFKGSNCNECSDGYYNSDSICMPCECNGNENPLISPRICNPDNGQCLSCIRNTTGDHCEKCAEGYAGDAHAGNCTKIVTTTTSTTTTAQLTTMSTKSITNFTTLLTSTTQIILTTPPSSMQNTTTSASEVSWTQFNIIILAVIIVVVVVLMAFVGGVYMYREYQNRKLNAPFWTIELKEDNISFSSYHDSIPNADVSGLLEDDGNEVAPNGQLSLSAPINMYKA